MAEMDRLSASISEVDVQSALGMSTLEAESRRLEEEFNVLEARKRSLKTLLEAASHQHVEAVRKQKEHMSQVDSWRTQQRSTRQDASRCKEEVEKLELSASEERSRCDALLRSLGQLQAALAASPGRFSCDLHGTCEHVGQRITELSREVVAATEARLDCALKAVREGIDEHRRATSTLQLLDVRSQQTELPTQKELPLAVGRLQDAWAARATLGSVDLAKRSAVETIMREASSISVECAPSAGVDAKVAWAQRWADLGDVAVSLADAAAPTSLSSGAAKGGTSTEASAVQLPLVLGEESHRRSGPSPTKATQCGLEKAPDGSESPAKPALPFLEDDGPSLLPAD